MQKKHMDAYEELKQYGEEQKQQQLSEFEQALALAEQQAQEEFLQMQEEHLAAYKSLQQDSERQAQERLQEFELVLSEAEAESQQQFQELQTQQAENAELLRLEKEQLRRQNEELLERVQLLVLASEQAAKDKELQPGGGKGENKGQVVQVA